MLPGIVETPVGVLTLLDSPLGDNSWEPALDVASGKLQTFCNRLESRDAHTANFSLFIMLLRPDSAMSCAQGRCINTAVLCAGLMIWFAEH